MLSAPSIFCRVLLPIASPIVASAGHILAVWPGHPTHTLAVLSANFCTVIRHQQCVEGVLYGALLHLFLDAAIRPLTLADERALLRVA